MTNKLRLMLLEDNLSDAELVLHALRQAGFEPDWIRVETEDDYLAALDPDLDLVLADYKLPQFDGLRALDLLKARGLDIPFILVSGTIGEDLAVEAMKKGAADYFLKDRLARLGVAVTNALLQKKMRDEKRIADEAFRESEERYRTLFESASVGLGMTDDQGNFLTYNSAMLTPGGYQPEDITRIGNLASLYYDPAEGERVLALVREQGSLRRYEVRFKRKDGTPYNALLHLIPLNLGGKAHFLAVVDDVTERKRAEERFRLVFESAPNAFVLVNKQGGIVMVNSQAEKMFGYDRTELLDLNVDRLAPARFRRNHADHRTDYFSDTQTRPLGKERNLHGLRKDGSEFPVEISLTPIEREEGLLVMATIVDITERKQAAEKLAASEAELRALFAGMTDVVIVYDSNGRYFKIAPTNPVNLYRPPDEMLGKTVYDILPKEQADFTVSKIRESLYTSEVVKCEYALQFGRKEIWFFASVSPLSENTVIWVSHDITERRQAEEKIQQQLAHLSALREIDRAIAGSMDTHFVLDVSLNHLIAELKVDAAVVLLFDPSTQDLNYEIGIGFKSKALQFTHLRLGEGYAGIAALQRQTKHVPDLQSRKTDFLRSPAFSMEGFASYFGVPLIAKGEIKGVLEIFHRSPLEPDQEWLEFMETLAGQMAIAIDNASLYNDLQRSNLELVRAYDTTIEGWSRALDLRDKETEGHTQRVTKLTVQMARAMGVNEAEILHIWRGALLHDIGKMGVPDRILLKPDKLTEEEWEIMRKHPTFAYEMLSPIDYLKPALDIPYCHHEKWDGTGYPRNLKGEQIPLGARLFALVDVWDALTSDRPYRPAWTKEKAFAHIKEQSGKHFDPQVMNVFLETLQKMDGSLDGLYPP